MLTAIVVAAHLLDTAGWPFTPSLMLPIGLVAGAGTLGALGRRATWDRTDLAAFTAIASATFVWLMWIARPSFLPLGGGPDLTHHILLIQYIERHWRLVHVPGVEDYLGEMVYYTPGSHILAALAGAWARSTGFHAFHAVIALTVAIKTGFVYLIAMRVLPRDVPRVPLAAVGAISLFASQVYFLGSFADYSFLAQVVSELFAVAMWWALTAWDQHASRRLMLFAGLTGAAVFLTWPMLIGPPLVVLGALVVLPHPTGFSTRVGHAAIAVAPILSVAGLFMVGRTGMMAIAGAGGEAVWPSVDKYGWWFLALSTAGLVIAVVQAVPANLKVRTTTVQKIDTMSAGTANLKVRTTSDTADLKVRTTTDTRTIALFVLAIGLQTAALYGVASWHSNEPYMALKMFYLLLYPQAAGVSLAVATVTVRLKPDTTYVNANAVAWILVALAVFFVGRPLAHAPDGLIVAQHPAASLALEQAGEWARAHVPFKCVEYLVGDDETAYWLHLAVLGNARQGQRTGDNATYELTPTLVRWLTPGGLPYAIADLPALPTGVRDELDIVAQFGTAAGARRRAPSACDER
jgi:hypothetical protein